MLALPPSVRGLVRVRHPYQPFSESKAPSIHLPLSNRTFRDPKYHLPVWYADQSTSYKFDVGSKTDEVFERSSLAALFSPRSPLLLQYACNTLA